MKSASRTILLIGGICATLVSAACAELRIYRSPELTKETRTGIPFFISKPYLLVVRNGAKDTPLQASIIYLPDLSRPHYADIIPGMGSSKTSLTFTNSVLASVGQESDAQFDELLTSVGGLATSLATAGLTRQQTRDLREEAAPDYTAVARSLDTIATDLLDQATRARTHNVLTAEERGVVETTAAVLRAAAITLRDPVQREPQLPAVVASLQNAARNWDAQIREPSATPGATEAAIRRQLAALRAQITVAIQTLNPPTGGGPTYELYEIVISASGGTTLRRVLTE